ncbi:MAG: FAD/NAD(P)-binding protein, partial [Brevundimonas sp.]
APLPDHARMSRRLAAARTAAAAGGWRSLMELYRPVTADLWADLVPEAQRRLMRHLRPWWDVHRHRLAPEVAARIDALVAADRLQVLAGRIGRPRPGAGRLELPWRARGQTSEGRLVGDRLIDCSGPGHAPEDDPLTGPLLAAGAARLHPNGLGLDLDPDGRVLDADGRPQPRLFVLGPPARAAFWETIAVPDIRERIAALAAALTQTS